MKEKEGELDICYQHQHQNHSICICNSLQHYRIISSINRILPSPEPISLCPPVFANPNTTFPLPFLSRVLTVPHDPNDSLLLADPCNFEMSTIFFDAINNAVTYFQLHQLIKYHLRSRIRYRSVI